MKTTTRRTIYIIIMSVLSLAKSSIWAIFMGISKQSSREATNIRFRNMMIYLLDLVGVNTKIVNPHQTQPQEGKPTIIMCNHSSLYDIPLSTMAFPNHAVRMLAKKEMTKIPLMGKAMAMVEFPFIDRKNRDQARIDLALVKQLMASGIVIWIAPEGTRSKDGKIAPFKKGGFITAIETGATIIPIGIRGADRILSARSLQFYLNQTAEVHVGQAIDASKFTFENKEDLIEQVYTEIKRLAND